MQKFSSIKWQLVIPIVITLAVGLGLTIPALTNSWSTEPATSDIPAGKVLTVDEKDMWDLNLDNALLNETFSKAYNLVIADIPDAKLSEFDIDVFPYSTVSKVRLTYCFYSKSADREIDYVFRDDFSLFIERDISGVAIVNRITFDKLPWITNRAWLTSIKKAVERVGLLTPDDATGYLVWVVNSPTPTWNININDSVNWHWTLFQWEGKGDPALVKKFGEDITITHLLYYP